MKYRTHQERIERNTVKTPAGCWEWTGQLRGGGYGAVGLFINNKKVTAAAHRLSYETFKGPIATGMQIDHLCKNPKCCNPEHLEVVTPQENNRRSSSRSSVNARKTHCMYGHPFDEQNTATVPRGRKCRKCHAIYMRAWLKERAA